MWVSTRRPQLQSHHGSSNRMFSIFLRVFHILYGVEETEQHGCLLVGSQTWTNKTPAILWGESRRCCLIDGGRRLCFSLGVVLIDLHVRPVFGSSFHPQPLYNWGSCMPLVEVLQVQRNGGFTYLKQNCSKQSKYTFFKICCISCLCTLVVIVVA